MALTLNKRFWQELIDEDLEWLGEQERTLERDHVIDIIKSLRCVRPRALENFLRDEQLIESESQQNPQD